MKFTAIALSDDQEGFEDWFLTPSLLLKDIENSRTSGEREKLIETISSNPTQFSQEPCGLEWNDELTFEEMLTSWVVPLPVTVSTRTIIYIYNIYIFLVGDPSKIL